MNITLKVLFRIFLLIASSIGIGLLLMKEQYVLTVLLFFILVGIVIELFNYINRVNDKISFFFNAVQNNDSSLSFDVNVKNRSYRELNESLNRVNKLIQQSRKQEQTQEQYYKTMLNRVATGVLSYDNHGVIHHMNRQAESMFSLFAPHHITAFKQVDAIIYNALKTIKPGETKTVTITINNELKHFFLKAASFTAQKDTLTIISFEDIQYELDKNELESWNRLIRVITHEIMNTIAPITSLTSTLISMYKDQLDEFKNNPCLNELYDDTSHALNTIYEQTKALEKFVKTYRQLTNLPKPEMRSINLENWVNRIALLLEQHPDSKDVNIDVQVQSHSLSVMGDEEMLSQVLVNIGINSLQAMRDIVKDKALKISVHQDSTTKPVISIADNGCGMDEKLKERIFVPFFTTKETGSGIGLSLSRQIILMHKGSINIDSKLGEGTTVVIKL